jgi:hypothetical protein
MYFLHIHKCFLITILAIKSYQVSMKYLFILEKKMRFGSPNFNISNEVETKD